MSRPKTLAERLKWMAENLPGFREEIDAVLSLEQGTRAIAACESECDQTLDQVESARTHP